jgi:hypothetical protein
MNENISNLCGSCGICGVEQPTYVIKEHNLRNLFDWTCALGSVPFISFLDFTDRFLCVLFKSDLY